MDAISLIITVSISIAAGFGLLGLAAARWGVDSRPGIGDDHAR
ncbi:MAG TPA: hypothetical protein VLS28_06710 [Candidatus Sulfomarinibacteraceae bacterium]|nr:hypothetical protein [Candidatus Sulfomarinibacteraceae bacterium]